MFQYQTSSSQCLDTCSSLTPLPPIRKIILTNSFVLKAQTVEKAQKLRCRDVLVLHRVTRSNIRRLPLLSRGLESKSIKIVNKIVSSLVRWVLVPPLLVSNWLSEQGTDQNYTIDNVWTVPI